ncbi:hypothetical protein CFC21_053283 [Triticum aestivum]|uniref:Uncharacterized protein n=2 Tax=Triticum aestivum TaxID=4565 RepID=A0A3B6HXR6_WHEAT|nr:uncharacterized protein LOC123086972 [Triticum aestivum]KAF7043998.1 hypothetical protein CFC21_053283 [Triticum aestivum]
MVLLPEAASSLLLLFLLFATAAAAAAPMELYFSQAELARIAGYGEEPVSTVLVSGQVACQLCLRPGSDLLTFDLPGSKVAVTCATEGPNTMANSAFATTNEYGNFSIELPSRLHATPSLETACSVKVLELPPDSACRVGGGRGSSHGLRLSSSDGGVRTYTTGVIRLQHGGTPSGKCVQEEDTSDRR